MNRSKIKKWETGDGEAEKDNCVCQFLEWREDISCFFSTEKNIKKGF